MKCPYCQMEAYCLGDSRRDGPGTRIIVKSWECQDGWAGRHSLSGCGAKWATEVTCQVTVPPTRSTGAKEASHGDDDS